MQNEYNAIHKPILTEEMISFLNIQNNGIYLDATTGEGGHSEALLKRNPTIRLICNDRDEVILDKAKQRLSTYKDRVTFINSNFDDLNKNLETGTLNGIVADLGISSYHFDTDNRGFSFKEGNSLDMRLDDKCKFSASDIVNTFDEEEIADIIYKYGEERFSRRIARDIIQYRKTKKIESPVELQEIVRKSIPPKARPKKINPATKTFQALRIYINDELTHLERGIDTFVSLLNTNGILCILTFHSLEDRIVKNKFRNLSAYQGNRNPFESIREEKKVINILTKKPISPTREEQKTNPRSRSAKLRVAKKL
jgi:16S rRNA (cytosine1402-N4)-methyltransferase